MLFFYYGEDSFRARQKIQAIIQKFKEKIDPAGHNIQELDGETLQADDFFQAISVMGFLADKKLIVIKNIFDNPRLKDWQDALLNFLKKQKDTTDENYLIFWQTGLPDGRSKLYKHLNQIKFTEEFKALSPSQLVTWIKKQVAGFGKNISDGAVTLLISYVGNNLWQLNQEINKLVNFADKNIVETDVKTLVQAKIDENIFNLVDALGRKDKALALKLIEDQLDSGVNHQYILAMINRQFRLLIKAKSLGTAASYPQALMPVLKIPKMVADKILTQSKLYTMADLKKIYAELLELDTKFKSSSQSEKILFLQMINKL